ncbi:Hypothetical predicted protein [Olea europaea subsp. europaea]|uniref:Uncharacterized protein n=1 Tax=Olea europaea subsp. europaea TaxID=158383 RepID=A0A8S0RR51_OLEEU|nr:Hypothetical predicted protein [Olea europaea subsp. europaea]
MSIQRRDRWQPWRDRARDCGVRGARRDRKRGPSEERLEGRDSGKKLLQRREGSDSNRGGTGPAIAGSAEPAAIESEGPAGSAWRGGIAEKNCFSDEKAQGAIATAEDCASDCWVRGARGDRKRGASGERMEGSDGIQCISAGMVAAVSNCGPSVFDVSPAQGAIATAEGSGQQLWGPRSPQRSKAMGQWGALGEAG